MINKKRSFKGRVEYFETFQLKMTQKDCVYGPLPKLDMWGLLALYKPAPTVINKRAVSSNGQINASP